MAPISPLKKLHHRIYILKYNLPFTILSQSYRYLLHFNLYFVSLWRICTFRVRFFTEIQDWILKPQNGFCVSFLNRSIQDLSDHGTSKEPKNPCLEWILQHHDPRDLGFICLEKKSNICFGI